MAIIKPVEHRIAHPCKLGFILEKYRRNPHSRQEASPEEKMFVITYPFCSVLDPLRAVHAGTQFACWESRRKRGQPPTTVPSPVGSSTNSSPLSDSRNSSILDHENAVSRASLAFSHEGFRTKRIVPSRWGCNSDFHEKYASRRNNPGPAGQLNYSAILAFFSAGGQIDIATVWDAANEATRGLTSREFGLVLLTT